MMDFEAFYSHVQRFNEHFDAQNDPHFRLALVTTESSEAWEKAMKPHKFSKEEFAEELADLLYVVFGWADVANIDLSAAMLAVALKNQKKIDGETPIKIHHGKVMKEV